jgi:acetoin utilization deacetylase AcuC-like enzyme
VRAIPVVHHPLYVGPAISGPHPFNKNGLTHDLLTQSEHAIAWHEPEAMPRDWIEAVHDPAYVAEVIEQRVPREKERRIGFPVTPHVAIRAQHVPGGTWAAALLAMEHGYAHNNAGGSHHALAETGAGYCIFNDLAITAVRLTEEGRAASVLIVDCDVHQGDGTAVLTAGRPGIATYSIHAERNFPARKARSTLDVALADDTGDDAYLAALAETLLPFAEQVRPDIILYQGGVDPYAGDKLGRLALSQEGLDARDRLVAGLARRMGVPLAGTLGGGYGDDALEVARRHVRSVLTLAEVLL